MKSDGKFGSHYDTPVGSVTYFYESGTIEAQWILDDYKISEVKYYDQEGNLIKHLKDDDKAMRMAFIQRFADDMAETIIREMAMATEVYAESHNGEYFSITPTFESKILGNMDFTFQHCNSTWGPYEYVCTNSVDGYQYKAIPIFSNGLKGSKTMTFTTGEIYTENEI